MSIKRLGKGLDVLFKQTEILEDDQLREVDIELVRPNPYQPRKHFDVLALEELKESILQHGVIQPLIVRENMNGFEIVAGERRYRASKAAGLKEVPVVIRGFDDRQMMEIALIENLQREDLNPIEMANAYNKIVNQYGISAEELATKLGKTKTYVINYIRLLKLPNDVQAKVSCGLISMGHARALTGLQDVEYQRRLADKVINESLSVRQIEDAIKNLRIEKKIEENRIQVDTGSVDYLKLRHYEEVLRELFKTKVSIKYGRGKGKIEIEYYSVEDLDRLIDSL